MNEENVPFEVDVVIGTTGLRRPVRTLFCRLFLCYRDHLPTSIVTIGTDVVTAVDLARFRLDGQRGGGQGVMRTAHIAF